MYCFFSKANNHINCMRNNDTTTWTQYMQCYRRRYNMYNQIKWPSEQQYFQYDLPWSYLHGDISIKHLATSFYIINFYLLTIYFFQKNSNNYRLAIYIYFAIKNISLRNNFKVEIFSASKISKRRINTVYFLHSVTTAWKYNCPKLFSKLCKTPKIIQ